MSLEEIEQMYKDFEEQETNGFGRWGWFSTYYDLAKGDITKFEEVGEMNFIMVLNFLLYEKELKIKQQVNKPT